MAWAKLGVIALAVDPRYEEFKSGKTFSWDQYVERISGTDTKTVVTSTPKGDALMAKTVAKFPGLAEPKGHGLYILPGAFRVTRIVGNAGYRGSGTDWRLVSFLYDAAWEPVVKEWAGLMGHQLTEKRKGRMLLQYDPFKSTWSYGAVDLSNVDSQFATEGVPQTVRESQLAPVQK